MVRTGTVKNFLIVVMVASTYLTVRLMFFNDRHLRKYRQTKPSKPLHSLPSKSLPQQPPAVVIATRYKENQIEDCTSDLLGTPSSILQKNPSYRDITCEALLSSKDLNARVYKRAKEFQDKHKPARTYDDTFIQSAQDCQKFVASYGFHTKPVSQEEAEFPIAYNILLHKDIEQVASLLRAIYRPNNVYCLHVDNKQSEKFKETVRALARCFDNVYIASRLESIVYAGFTRLQADINCMKDQLVHPVQWKYLFNIAAQSFPLKTNLEMVRILRVYGGSNDIEGIYGARVHRGRFEIEWKEVNVGSSKGKLARTGGKNPPAPHHIDIVRGSAYGVFSRQFVHYIIHDQKAKDLLEWSRKTWSPDEHYWATLHHTYTNPHLDTPGGFTGKPDSKPWLAVWVAWGGQDMCHGMWRRGTCVFGVQDLPKLASRHEFFANKFYWDHHPLVLECLSNWLEFKDVCPSRWPLDLQYYKALPFVRNKGS